ncbi:hypothetical protein D3C76_577390 [compost metagenome]
MPLLLFPLLLPSPDGGEVGVGRVVPGTSISSPGVLSESVGGVVSGCSSGVGVASGVGVVPPATLPEAVSLPATSTAVT